MSRLHIFIETSAPVKGKKGMRYTNEYYFVEQYLRHLRPGIGEDEYEITCVGGKDNLKNYDNAMRQTQAEGGHNIVVFDCDSQAMGGGIEERKRQMETLKQKLGIDFGYFFFPNNKDDGAFEELLLNITNPRHRGILDCFDKYEMCIGGQKNAAELYQTPNSKAKIYAYVTTFMHSRSENEKIKSGDWSFHNLEYWDLDSEYLTPLKEFLEGYL